ncbi:hypothetical protein RM704_43570 [Streptomyces sp. DSM 3412]|uniref:Uncharacterized protein n=1 Tax=Streptomyces gottesmaniae TaxID=3075518 RepID=A0ABU2ZCE2_9ACTN|nr:hypothetical protein [Streptomyces sp. DSM 3412]MDT0574258.1 hypothetical protein [Streptomyces sp. DSM 3412]
MSPTEIPPTVIIGLHGILQRHPWLNRVVERDPESSVEEDVLGLAIDRAGAYGWQTVSTWLSENGQVTAHHEPTAWAQEEVGGDWTDDGRVHQLAWAQAGVLSDSVLPGLPVRPIALVLSETLARVGEVTFTGLHALLPLRAGDRNTAFHQTELAPWFGLADPDARHEVVVTVSGLPTACALDEDDVMSVCDAVRDMAQDSVTDFSSSAAEVGLPPGLELDLDRVLHTQGMREVARFGCRTREWSPDVAVWLLEMVADGLRGAGLSTQLVITVSLAAASPAPSSATA